MKLYTTGKGHWAGTQADARKLKKKHSIPCELYEVPVSKQELLEFLNGNIVKTDASFSPVESTAVPERVNTSRTTEGHSIKSPLHPEERLRMNRTVEGRRISDPLHETCMGIERVRRIWQSVEEEERKRSYTPEPSEVEEFIESNYEWIQEQMSSNHRFLGKTTILIGGFVHKLHCYYYTENWDRLDSKSTSYMATWENSMEKEDE